MLAIYVGLGIAVPAAVIAARDEAEGGVGKLRTEELTAQQEEGKTLFVAACKTCHNLDAVQANGVTGPDLDELGGLDKERVLEAIRNGGSGQGRMPARLLENEEAEAVAAYVARVAGQ
jgi:mono/diheme cytochrome c family protein